MRLFLTGEPCTQQRHCYFVRGRGASFIVDCGYQRCYGRDALPHITPEQIHESQYLFLTHSHENQSGADKYEGVVYRVHGTLPYNLRFKIQMAIRMREMRRESMLNPDMDILQMSA